MSWARILGHEHLVGAFTHVMQRRRLAHAYLFAGPAGIGKRLFAQELAKALLCEATERTETTLAACDHCAACALIDAGTHPDFFTVQRPEDKNEMPIDLVQELCAGFSLKSARGHGKVAILDDADDLNEESANCFLKTLEEPPPRSVFILVGTSLDRQLPTILSRCQTVRFAPLSDAAVEEVLTRQEGFDPALLKRSARLAGGSPGQAIALADATLWEFRKKLLAGLSAPKVDSVALGKAFVEFVEDAGKEGSLQRRRGALMLRLLIEALTDALTLAVGGQPRAAEPDDLPFLRALTSRAHPDKIVTLIERCLETEQHIDRYVQLTLVLEALLDSLAQGLE